MANLLTPRMLVELRTVLEQEQKRLRASLGSLGEAERAFAESQGEESAAGGSLADVASDATEQTLELSLERTERERLREVEAALRRMDEGRYGRCERCGLPIPIERLQVMPWTRYCLACALRSAEHVPQLLAD